MARFRDRELNISGKPWVVLTFHLFRHRSNGACRWVLKATMKATPVDAHGQGSTIQHVGLARRIQNNP